MVVAVVVVIIVILASDMYLDRNFKTIRSY